MSADERHKPGQICPLTAQWTIFRDDGEPSGAERQVDKGEPFPPLPVPGFTYGNPDVTRGGNPMKNRPA